MCWTRKIYKIYNICSISWAPETVSGRPNTGRPATTHVAVYSLCRPKRTAWAWGRPYSFQLSIIPWESKEIAPAVSSDGTVTTDESPGAKQVHWYRTSPSMRLVLAAVAAAGVQ
jgi:hypothetical protein